jgi:hypothetical protein
MTPSSPAVSFGCMTNDPRTTNDAERDLRLLLAEADREDPILSSPAREETLEGEEALDGQILAGLVTP